MSKKRRKVNPWLLTFLLVSIGVLIYLNVVVVPMMDPPFVPTSTPTRDPQSFIAEADALAAEGKYLQAIEILPGRDQRQPARHHQLPQNLAPADLHQSIGPGAGQCPKRHPAQQLRLRSLRPLGLGEASKVPRRRSRCQKAIELDQNDGLGHAILAYILALRVEAGLEDLDTMDRAIEESRTARRLSPTCSRRTGRGYVLEITSNYAEAVTELDAAIAINPTSPGCISPLGATSSTPTSSTVPSSSSPRLTPQPHRPNPNLFISRVYSMLGEWDKGISTAALPCATVPPTRSSMPTWARSTSARGNTIRRCPSSKPPCGVAPPRMVRSWRAFPSPTPPA